ncbi:MAG: SDR family NAD(P)-dependent oxidoreductase [Gemmatimonadetes bacterium]|nr:SDR family NAD(P)-dependent oxidoreductase [Gemmatimonadota bacterium]NNM35198.1 SDR family NAD(P)-dependent oxidoreductase [Gemmatimonadota bacterium]
MALDGKVALVAGATRGAGRGIARALGEAGATVYCTGRSSRSGSVNPKRPETIEETAELVGAAGGQAVAVRVDHTDESQVERLVRRIREDHGGLDVLVNDIWGGDALTEWGRSFWEVDVDQGFRMMELAIHTHIITSRHAVPLTLDRPGGLVVEITDGAFSGYRGQIFYDLCKACVSRLAYAMSVELSGRPITALAMTPGFLRSEAMLDHFGVSEANWRDAVAQDRHFAQSETPLYVGRAIAALAADPEVGRYAGRTLTSWDIAREYGLRDADGSQPHWDDHLDSAIEEILRRGSPEPDDLFLLRIRLNQLDFDESRADERRRIEELLAEQEG